MTDEPRDASWNEMTEAAEDVDVPKPRKRLPLRTKLLFVLLAATCSAFAVNAGHIYMLEGELKAIAAEKELDQQENLAGFSGGVETASTVTASKANLFFGGVSGKIEFFTLDILLVNGSSYYRLEMAFLQVVRCLLNGKVSGFTCLFCHLPRPDVYIVFPTIDHVHLF